MRACFYIVGVGILLSACSSSRQAVEWNTAVETAVSGGSLPWRIMFPDPLLARLIELGLEHNAEIRTANLNVEQAEAALQAARLALLPSLTNGAEGSLSKTKGAATTKTYNIPLTMQWEADLAGRLRGEKRAAAATRWSASELERAARLQMVTAVASHYATLAMMDEQLAVTRQSIDNARRTVEVMEAMKEAGMQNEAAVSQSRVFWFSVSASEKSLMQQIKATENALSVLIGQKQDKIGRAVLESIEFPINDSRSYPLSILAHRPDVKAAEYALKAQMAQVDVARAAFYPSLTISASAGWTNNIGEVVNPGQMLLNALGSLVQPLFAKGQNRANLRIAKARQKQALVAFNQSLLVAGAELSDALTACRLSREKLRLCQQEVAAAQRAYDVSQDLMQNGSNTYLEVLTAQAALLQSRLSLAASRLDRLQGQINLFKALGGKL
ncbi:MAG: efflux transporter outer membrane subunit [Deltaproteobacteria bacterium]|nr:efflux transporter outer membrane subunit [Deltaproteobacteria bacterium]